MSQTKKAPNKDVVTLPLDKFAIIDDNATYQFKDGYLYIAIEMPKDVKEVVNIDNLSGSGKTFRVYTNSTNRKFIKNSGFKDVQIQINSYLSAKDAEKLKGLNDEQLDAIEEAKLLQKK